MNFCLIVFIITFFYNNSMKNRGFAPDEIIFASTTACNLHCEHCFVNRTPHKLDIEHSVAFLRDCAAGGRIKRVGFSGGEPFLYMDFLLALIKETVKLDLLFDQIMTNGDWWKDETELNTTLKSLYDAGYDGKIGLSWDSYHGQTQERMEKFISAVQNLFGEASVNIQAVDKDLPRTYPSEDPRAWQAKRWFREDYCQGPGNIFYVHTDGNIAPCCGFANENPALFIGTITDSFETIMKNAAENKMVQLCFTKGLSRYRRLKKFPGKTQDICSFCDYVCKDDSFLRLSK